MVMKKSENIVIDNVVATSTAQMEYHGDITNVYVLHEDPPGTTSAGNEVKPRLAINEVISTASVVVTSDSNVTKL